jgi:hypothetical protein
MIESFSIKPSAVFTHEKVPNRLLKQHSKSNNQQWHFLVIASPHLASVLGFRQVLLNTGVSFKSSNSFVND